MEWKLISEQEPDKEHDFLLEWDGGWVKARYWYGYKVYIWWRGLRQVFDIRTLQDRYWLEIPVHPATIRSGYGIRQHKQSL
jgi:hypothetical protein